MCEHKLLSFKASKASLSGAAPEKINGNNFVDPKHVYFLQVPVY